MMMPSGGPTNQRTVRQGAPDGTSNTMMTWQDRPCPPQLAPPPTRQPPYPYEYSHPPPNMNGGEFFPVMHGHHMPPGQQPLPPPLPQYHNMPPMQQGAGAYHYHGAPDYAWMHMPSPQYQQNPEAPPRAWAPPPPPPPGHNNNRPTYYASGGSQLISLPPMTMPLSGHYCVKERPIVLWRPPAYYNTQRNNMQTPNQQPWLYGQQPATRYSQPVETISIVNETSHVANDYRLPAHVERPLEPQSTSFGDVETATAKLADRSSSPLQTSIVINDGDSGNCQAKKHSARNEACGLAKDNIAKVSNLCDDDGDFEDMPEIDSSCRPHDGTTPMAAISNGNSAFMEAVSKETTDRAAPKLLESKSKVYGKDDLFNPGSPTSFEYTIDAESLVDRLCYSSPEASPPSSPQIQRRGCEATVQEVADGHNCVLQESSLSNMDTSRERSRGTEQHVSSEACTNDLVLLDINNMMASECDSHSNGTLNTGGMGDDNGSRHIVALNDSVASNDADKERMPHEVDQTKSQSQQRNRANAFMKSILNIKVNSNVSEKLIANDSHVAGQVVYDLDRGDTCTRKFPNVAFFNSSQATTQDVNEPNLGRSSSFQVSTNESKKSSPTGFDDRKTNTGSDISQQSKLLASLKNTDMKVEAFTKILVAEPANPAPPQRVAEPDLLPLVSRDLPLSRPFSEYRDQQGKLTAQNGGLGNAVAGTSIPLNSTRRRGPTPTAYGKFEKILRSIWNLFEAQFVRHNVSSAEEANPLYLENIREKLNNRDYKTNGDIVHDFRQIIFNQRLYFKGVPPVLTKTDMIESRLNKLLTKYFSGWDFRQITGHPAERRSNRR